MNLLNKIPFIRATRRNHALEHATMKILASRYPGGRMMGHSNPTGFILFADLPTELVTEAALEARKRLQNGEADLAIHPGCGTNLATSAFLAGAAAFLVLNLLSGAKSPKWWHYLLAAVVAVPVYIFSRPLGPKVQEELTVDPNIEGLEVDLVRSYKTKNGFFHIIKTRR